MPYSVQCKLLALFTALDTALLTGARLSTTDKFLGAQRFISGHYPDEILVLHLEDSVAMNYEIHPPKEWSTTSSANYLIVIYLIQLLKHNGFFSFYKASNLLLLLVLCLRST